MYYFLTMGRNSVTHRREHDNGSHPPPFILIKMKKKKLGMLQKKPVEFLPELEFIREFAINWLNAERINNPSADILQEQDLHNMTDETLEDYLNEKIPLKK